MAVKDAPIRPETTEAVLSRLGLDRPPETTLEGLSQVYLSWGRSVPFDNLVKRIHLASGDPAPIPNIDPEGFFASYLRHGTGGTCWPSSAALHALLVALGFDARLGSASMREMISGPLHTHGTCLVRLDGVDHWVDSSMLTERPLALLPATETAIDDPVNPIRAEPAGDTVRIWWQQPSSREQIDCLLLSDDVDLDHYRERYEASRERSPFNLALYSSRNRGGSRITVVGGRHFAKHPDGSLTSTEPEDGISAFLVEELGYSEEIVAALPPT